MRLLQLKTDGSFSLVPFANDKIPPYAILSHTWGQGEDDEVTFKDLVDGTGDKKRGFQKLRFCGNQAKANDLHYFWVDTCCIDKSNNNELTTAINSMFRWYKNAARCYVYLLDVSVYTQDGQSRHIEWESTFRNSRWFTRGWTLQELLAPKIVEFFSYDRIRLGDKRSLEQQIHEITGIAVEALQGRTLDDFSVGERLKWGWKRQTTEEEDEVYCLLGIFKIFMSLRYGEGRRNAMDRLLRKIQKSSNSRWQDETFHLDRRTPIFQGCPMRLTTFVGREEDLGRLAIALKAPTRQIPTVVVLQGMGGQGKTQVALEYCYRARSAKELQAILWLDATSKETMDESFNAISEALKPPGRVLVDSNARRQLVIDLLEQWQEPWLIVFDNYDSPREFPNIGEYIPKSELGKVIVTSREPDTCDLGTRIVISGMPEAKALELLQQISELSDVSEHGLEIVKRMGGLPLAIHQAGAYIRDRKDTMTLKNFLEIYEQKTFEIFESVPEYWKYAATIFTTWELSLTRLHKDAEIADEIGEFLSLLGFFAPNNISESLFEHYSLQLLKDSLLPTPKWMKLFTNEHGRWSQIKFMNLASRLKKLYLVMSTSRIDNDSGPVLLSLHPLVSDWLRLRKASRYSQETRFRQYTLILAYNIMKFAVNTALLASTALRIPVAAKAELLSHAHDYGSRMGQYLDTSKDPTPANGPLKDVTSAEFWIAGLFEQSNQFARALTVFDSLWQNSIVRDHRSHRAKCKIGVLIGLCHTFLNDQESALAASIRLTTYAEQWSQSGNSVYWGAFFWEASVHNNCGSKFHARMAEKICRRALDRISEYEEEERPQATLYLNVELANALVTQGGEKMVEAEGILTKIIETKKISNINGHTTIPWEFRQWAVLLEILPDVQEKEELANEAMLLIETQLGREHFYYTWARYFLTNVLIQKKQFLRAEKLAKQCIRDTKNMSPRQDSDLLLLSSLRWSLQGQGKLAEAEDVMQEMASASKVRRRPLAQPDQALQGSTADRKLDVGFVNRGLHNSMGQDTSPIDAEGNWVLFQMEDEADQWAVRPETQEASLISPNSH